MQNSAKQGRTEDEEPLVLCQFLSPVDHVMTQIQLLCSPETSLRSFIRLPYLRVSPEHRDKPKGSAYLSKFDGKENKS